jgi:hypothetical protein
MKQELPERGDNAALLAILPVLPRKACAPCDGIDLLFLI